MDGHLPVSDEMVERVARVMAANDWLPDGWSDTHDGLCPACGQSFASDGDGGDYARRQIRTFLEAAFEGDAS